MPLPGGASDKFGNRYEGRWTVLQMAELIDERADSLRLEPPGTEGDGVEFWVRRGTAVEYHQIKRQYGSEGRWTIGELSARRVLTRFFDKLNDLSATCVFVSSHAAYQLDELSDRARRAASWEEYDRAFLNSQDARTTFDELCSTWSGCAPEEVYSRLKRIKVRTIDEETLRTMIESRLAVLVEGQPPSALVAILAEFALDKVHYELTALDIWRHIESQGCKRSEWGKDPHVIAAVEAQNNRYLGFLRGEAIRGRLFPRDEAQLAVNRILSQEGKRSVMLAGEAGVGKSSVMTEIVERLQGAGLPVLVFRVDRLEQMPTPDRVGEDLGLPGSPAHVLAAMAQGRDCALVIDQLDAVSLASGRNPQFFECINEIINQALTHKGMRIVLGCRKFDIDNDYRLRRLVGDQGVAEIVAINRLAQEKVREIVKTLGLDEARLTKRQLDLLSIPLNLYLLSELASDTQTDALNFETTKDLYDEFWRRKQALVRLRLGRDVQWTQVIDALCVYMNERQILSAREAILDQYQADANVMVSEHILTLEGGNYSFFHESFFDYAFARRFAARGLRLLPFLLNGEQDLFQRAQVRQILLHEREQDRNIYLDDLSSLLFDDRIRYHLKSAAFALLKDIAEPTIEEWRIICPPLENVAHSLYVEVWGLLHRSPAWFELVDSSGLIENWLSNNSPQERIDRTVTLLRSMQRSLPDRVADLLDPKLGTSVEWNNRIVFVLQWSGLDSSRKFFELFLRAVDTGAFDNLLSATTANSDFWDLSHDLPEKQPAWAAELICHFYNRLVMTSLDMDGADLSSAIVNNINNSARHGREDYFSKVAHAAPREFAEQILPLMLRIMELTIRPAAEQPRLDGVWFYRSFDDAFCASDLLLDAMVGALSFLVLNEPETFVTYAARLRATEFETAHFILVRVYAANGARFANEAAAYLCEEEARLSIGYSNNDHWAARQLLEAISQHCSEEALFELESLLLNYYTDYEQSVDGRRAHGHAQFTLLEGIVPARRSERIKRRLDELRRKFGKETVAKPIGMIGGFVGSPIDDKAASKMTDEQWLRAIEHYDRDDVDTRIVGNDLIGGAGELAGLMEGLARQNRPRFAELACRFSNSVNIRYFEAVLRGVADANLDPQLALRLCRRCHDLPTRPLGRWIPPVIARLAEADLPDEALDIVAYYATQDRDPEEELWCKAAYGGQPYFGGSIDTAAINSVRGIAAEVIGHLIFPTSARLTKLMSTVEQMVNDALIVVRASVAGALISVLKHDRDLAVRLFLRLCETEDALLRTNGVERFMKYGLRTHYNQLAPVLDRMLKADHEEANIAGARQACLAALFDEEARQRAENCARESEAHRRGAAQVFAANIGEARFRSFCERHLISFFNDPSEEVRSEAANCFGHLKEEQAGDYDELADAFIISEAFVHEHRSLFRTLEKTPARLPDTTCSAAERFFDIVGSDSADMRTHGAAESYTVTKLIVRTYAQSKSSEAQGRCLDLIDRVTRLRAFGLAEAIEEYER